MTAPAKRQQVDTQQVDERLAQTFHANGRYNVVFLSVTGIGFVVIYLLTSFNLLGGEPVASLLYISGAVIVMAILQIPAISLARQNRGIAANFMGTLSVVIFAILLTAFWQGIVLLIIAVTLITPITAIRAGLPRRNYPALFVLVVVGIGGILYVNANSPFTRLQTATPPAIASLAFLSTTGLLLATVAISARSKSYRSLRNQLLASFIVIVTIPTLLATVLSAVGAYVNNEAQVFNVLETVSILKEEQVNEVISNFKVDAARINQDSAFSRNALKLLTPAGTDEEILALYRSSARSRLLDFKAGGDQSYEEIMVVNVEGFVVLATDPGREGKSFQSELFYSEGSLGDFAGFSQNPTFGRANLVYSTPIYDTGGKAVRGVLVLRANSDLIRNIMETTPAFSEMETYLLEQRLEVTTEGERLTLEPLTQTRQTPPTFNTQELLALLNSGSLSGNNLYANYAGETVLGYYKRLEFLDVFMIAEAPRSFILDNSINSLLGSSALAVFAIAIAIAAVAISAASIAEPISALAKTAQSFAEGKLSSRAAIDRRDEIGALGSAYDQMAEQLQDIIGRLEQRVSDRTKELEDQTVRLRAAAEIARDAASSRNLDELLEKAGALLQERFGLYHTGIFLLDNNREYAILTSSPTEAGKQMIANGHKLRVGEVGIVGRVASTGEPRISLDTGIDAVYFNNPYLPETRSEMALPLKVEKNLIGILDVQSDQPQAFDENDIAVMLILADQLATAIERTRLHQQAEQNLKDLEQAYGQFTREDWKTLGDSGLLSKAGYRFDNVRIQPITEVSESGDEALKTGALAMRGGENNPSGKDQVAIPIKLRGQTIGVVTANLKDGYAPNTVSTLQLAIERLALSLESARLYEETRLRADREQNIAHVTSSISSATEFDTILRTTVEEVGRLLGDSEVSIQIVSDAEPTDR